MSNTKERIRPKRPNRQLTMAERDCVKHPEVRPLEESVSSRIEALLARADGLMTGKEYHVLFDARGERHARAIAEADGQAGGLGSSGRHPGQCGVAAICPHLHRHGFQKV